MKIRGINFGIAFILSMFLVLYVKEFTFLDNTIYFILGMINWYYAFDNEKQKEEKA